MSKKTKKENNPQIEVRTFNWGPCVIKLKIQDDFKKALLDEIKKIRKSDEDSMIEINENSDIDTLPLGTIA